MFYVDPHFGMSTEAGHEIPLKSVNIEAIFKNLLCETRVEQVYENRENKPVEALYTFPVSSRAVLLDLSVTIGDRNLKGTVTEKSAAEEKYEDAIADGDAAVMLEEVEPGMFTMNVGNLMPGEEIRISICYAELYAWNGNSLRFHLPTTIAPRYGRPEYAGLEPHQIPEHDITAENRFRLRIVLTGILTSAEVKCPTHDITVKKSAEKTDIMLTSGEAFMDRDFILNITMNESESGAAARDCVTVEPDPISGYVALASFMPILQASDLDTPRNIKIVVDCSGSMNGDSITQARQAISEILKLLRPGDFFNIIAFGSTYRTFFDRQVPADPAHITKARRRLRNLDADMGGTEIYAALDAAIHLSGSEIPPDILLITDGEVWRHEKVTERMAISDHRIFTVGVGSAVSEGFLRGLAEATGGACELVVPNEEMAEKIVRHFRRIKLHRAEKVEVRWPQEPEHTFPENMGPAYDGDTLHAFAWFKDEPSGTVSLDMRLADGSKYSQKITMNKSRIPDQGKETLSAIARIGAHNRMKQVKKDEATELAVNYQLVSPYTNYIVVAVRDQEEKAHELPTLRKVPQMMAAGWGGTGRVSACEVIRDQDPRMHHIDYSMDIDHSIVYNARTEAPSSLADSIQSPSEFINRLNRLMLIHRDNADLWAMVSSMILHKRGIPFILKDAINHLASQYSSKIDEKACVVLFLMALLQSDIGHLFSKEAVKAIKEEGANRNIAPEIAEHVSEVFTRLLRNISKDKWGV